MKFATLALALSGVTAFAHHNIDSTYDLKREVEVEGQIISVLLRNPHSFLQIEAAGNDGAVQRWSFEFPKGSNSLLKQGIQPGTLKAGDQVTITINPPLKSAANRGNIVALRRESDGFEWRAKAKRNHT